ncbi:unnamed protein product [Merluccius merluccius]
MARPPRGVPSSRRRRRRERLQVQVCVVLGLLGATWGLSALTDGVHVDSFTGASLDQSQRRRLLAVTNDTLEINCTEPAIHQFPTDIFSNSQRRQGAVVLHIVAAMYMFLALAIVCDDYFVVSLEKICEKLSLSEDVAGATFMATGSSAPELFASIIGPTIMMTSGEEGNHEQGLNSPFRVPGSPVDIFKWLVSWPIVLLLFLTVPDINQPHWKKYFLVAFFASTLWIGIFSYVMVWMVTVIGFTLGIPDVIMGITFLAAGTSIPDCMASLLVARKGHGDMAVSNSLGSNVFDILIGLGVPWSIQTLAVNMGSQVQINSRGLFYSVVLLLGSVTLAVLGVHCNGWRLDTRLGVYALLLYVVFLTFSILIEYNVFTFINLPMCLEG